jgi:hypothetical protein
VVILPNAAALSAAQVAALRRFVAAGGGLVATGETSLCDEIGRPRRDFALADVFGVGFLGRPAAPTERPPLDENFARTLDEAYWQARVGVARLTWKKHELLEDARLQELVPQGSVICRGPLVRVSEPQEPSEVIVRMSPAGVAGEPLPAIIAPQFGKGRVVYLAAGIDAALWSYAYPYQRRLLTRAIEWVAARPAPFTVKAPLCVQATAFWQDYDKGRQRLVMHFFNGINTAGNHGLPANDVPLREEIVPIHGIELTLHGLGMRKLFLEPGHKALEVSSDRDRTTVKLPPLEIHSLLVGEA